MRGNSRALSLLCVHHCAEEKEVMAEREGGSATPWIAFLVGVVLMAVVAVGFFAMNPRGADNTADLEITLPDVKTPEIDLPDPPAPSLPPSADASGEAAIDTAAAAP